jgi:ribonuclease BN (tRNA processing enzyme)
MHESLVIYDFSLIHSSTSSNQRWLKIIWKDSFTHFSYSSVIDMKITLLGTGTSYPDPNRVQSGILLESESESILMDIGSGILHRLTQHGIDLDAISSIFISHFHIDHCSDFLTFCQSIWLSGTRRTLNLYGPPSMIDWLYSLHNAFPYLSDKVIIQPSILQKNESIKLENMVVANTPTIHGKIDTRAFKIESGGKILVYSSDTAPNKELNVFSKNADVFVHECNWLDGTHPEGVHTTPRELGLIAKEIEPEMLILTHLSPEVVQNKEEVIEIVSSKTEAKVLMAEDLMSFNI